MYTSSQHVPERNREGPFHEHNDHSSLLHVRQMLLGTRHRALPHAQPLHSCISPPHYPPRTWPRLCHVPNTFIGGDVETGGDGKGMYKCTDEVGCFTGGGAGKQTERGKVAERWLVLWRVMDQGVFLTLYVSEDATIYVGNITEAASEELLWELFVQVGKTWSPPVPLPSSTPIPLLTPSRSGPVVNVHIPRDKVTNQHQGFGFVEFRGEEEADYAIKILNMIKLHGQPLRLNKKASGETGAPKVRALPVPVCWLVKDVPQLCWCWLVGKGTFEPDSEPTLNDPPVAWQVYEVGANLFVGNLDPEVDEKLMYDTFSAFGVITGNTPKVHAPALTNQSALLAPRRWKVNTPTLRSAQTPRHVHVASLRCSVPGGACTGD